MIDFGVREMLNCKIKTQNSLISNILVWEILGPVLPLGWKPKPLCFMFIEHGLFISLASKLDSFVN